MRLRRRDTRGRFQVPRSVDMAALRELPGVETVLQSEAAAHWEGSASRELLADLVRAAITSKRESILAGEPQRGSVAESIASEVSRTVQRLSGPSLRRVINASGVILHTNLGRAPLSAAAVDAIRDTAAGYVNLEYDIDAGQRGRRDTHCDELLRELLGADAIIVNNNAAAILLVLNELARDAEVIVSRGELVEIGDGFRIAEILAASTARLVEVGATNRTHLRDYRQAIRPSTRVILRIHPSNFRMEGFTGRPDFSELVALAEEHSLPVVEDLGSGCLTDLTSVGIEDEPPVTKSLGAGASLVTFSGDKLLGGPQAGIIAGSPELVARCRRNPMFRALRVDKLTHAALQATLRHYLGDAKEHVPALRMLHAPSTAVEGRANRMQAELEALGGLQVSVICGESVLGGGSTPMQRVPTALIAIEPPAGTSAAALERRLRSHATPVIARIERNRVLLDLRTVFETEEQRLVAALREALER